MAVAGNKNVLGLQVTVDDASCVEAFNALDNLGGVETCSISAKSSPSCKLGSKVPSGVEVLRDGRYSPNEFATR